VRTEFPAQAMGRIISEVEVAGINTAENIPHCRHLLALSYAYTLEFTAKFNNKKCWHSPAGGSLCPRMNKKMLPARSNDGPDVKAPNWTAKS
jgi:hypothetical protein